MASILFTQTTHYLPSVPDTHVATVSLTASELAEFFASRLYSDKPFIVVAGMRIVDLSLGQHAREPALLFKLAAIDGPGTEGIGRLVVQDDKEMWVEVWAPDRETLEEQLKFLPTPREVYIKVEKLEAVPAGKELFYKL